MPWAEFEEKEYEAPLYNQMEAGHPNVWSPGQVFEHTIGIDHGMLVTDPKFWRHIGLCAVRPGSVLSRLDFRFLASPLRRSMPDFRMNVFIQAKRCQRLMRITPIVRDCGITSPCYRFNLDLEQRDVLANISNSLGNDSYVCYAAPAFHTLSQLYRYTRLCKIMDESTFPSAASLAGHKAWYYNEAGAVGVANQKATYFEDSTLLEKIRDLVRRGENEIGSASKNLKKLANRIVEGAESSIGSDESLRRSVFFDQLRLVDKMVKGFGFLREDIRNFLTVDLFSIIFNVQWYVIG